MRYGTYWLSSALFVLAASSLAAAPQNAPMPAGGAPAAQRQAPPPMRLMSTDIADGKQLPAKFTCAAGNDAVSPALQWVQPPRGTMSFALIVHDMEPRPRKGVDDILHWLVWNMPAIASALPQGVSPASSDLPDGSHQTNGFAGQGGNFGYRPPCPPQDVPVAHHYAFELFALDQMMELPDKATRADLMKAMDGHIAGHASLVAPFNR
ncbi:MAG: YbhB/YbcL family Raf kinase inhibitor-like protein [Acidobacteriia bacterium]|nr:YbhB/YbcL family Raf kinase inhibitor-like protein [Terriglobia bacterium]